MYNYNLHSKSQALLTDLLFGKQVTERTYGLLLTFLGKHSVRGSPWPPPERLLTLANTGDIYSRVTSRERAPTRRRSFSMMNPCLPSHALALSTCSYVKRYLHPCLADALQSQPARQS